MGLRWSSGGCPLPPGWPSILETTMPKLKPPEKGGKPKEITTSAPPGGDQTPGAKKAKEMESKVKAQTTDSAN